MLQSLILVTTSLDLVTRRHLAAKHSLVDLSIPTTELLLHTDPDQSIGIDAVRALQGFFATKPTTGNHKTAIFLYADNLTREAQHALLKTLEEPPEFAQILLVTHHTHHLLPTILSRCQIVTTKAPPSTTTTSPDTLALLQQLPRLSAGQKLVLSDTHNQDKSHALDLTQQLVHHFRHQLHHQPGPHPLYNLTLTLYTTKLLNQNTNPKLAIDNLFLHLK